MIPILLYSVAEKDDKIQISGLVSIKYIFINNSVSIAAYGFDCVDCDKFNCRIEYIIAAK